MQRVADLVDRALFTLPEPSLVVERLLLEEEADPVARTEEIAVLGVAVAGGREDGPDLARVERRDQFRHPGAQHCAFRPCNEPRQDQKAVALEPLSMAGRDHDRRLVSSPSEIDITMTSN